MIQKALALILSLITIFTSNSQVERGLSINYKHGYLGAHRPTIAHLPIETARGIELSYINTLTYSNKGQNIPHAKGVALLYMGSGNPEKIGDIYGLYGHATWPFWFNDKISLESRSGLGLGYVDKVFDFENNPLNPAIGSHLNALVSLRVNLKYFFKQSSLSFGTELLHLSNGALKLPNFGLNYMFLNLNYARKFGVEDKEKSTVELNRSRNAWLMRFCFGAKEIPPSNQDRYGIGSLALGYRQTLNALSQFEGIVEFNYNSSLRGSLPAIEKDFQDYVQVGAFVGHSVHVNRFSSILGMGVYLVDKFNLNGPFFHRFGVRYEIIENLQLEYAVRAFWGRADYFEFGISYYIPHKK